MEGRCPVCGAPIEGGVCSYCNYQAINQTEPSPSTPNYSYVGRTSSKNRILALILCAMFGYLGVHRFYVGKNRTGFIWLFTVGAFGIGWIMDLIQIATGTFKDDYGFVLKG